MAAAEQAVRQKLPAISVAEFGVAGGSGLVALQEAAAAVERETGVAITVYGFDTGKGLPTLLTEDHRDHPDIWQAGDFPMDEPKLRSMLSSRTKLVLGNVTETAANFFQTHEPHPLGFISVDVDLYSSTVPVLNLVGNAAGRMLHHMPMYFDDVDMVFTHARAGELLAISEFNQKYSQSVFIDQWRGLKAFRPFPEAPYLERMYLAHDLTAISAIGKTYEEGRKELVLSDRVRDSIGKPSAV